MKGKIVLIPFPFTDLTAAKLRPALVLFEGERDVVVAFVSSRVPQKLALADVLVKESHPEFVLTGLKVSSVIKLDKIATLLKDLVVGEIGELGDELKRKVNQRLRKVYRL
ncbi:MAG: type II toxin-antitoxin system PemK/MazF family toxin [Candidatus Bathycorpusculaceae bacterium]